MGEGWHELDSKEILKELCTSKRQVQKAIEKYNTSINILEKFKDSKQVKTAIKEARNNLEKTEQELIRLNNALVKITNLK